MKKYLLTTMMLCSLLSFAQTPLKFNYTALIRNSSNQVLSGMKVSLRISILKESELGEAIFIEKHTPQTNSKGYINIQIGAGDSILNKISGINWANSNYFLKTEVDPDGYDNYTIIGISQLLSVPYALQARTSESSATLQYPDGINDIQPITNTSNYTVPEGKNLYISTASSSNNIISIDYIEFTRQWDLINPLIVGSNSIVSGVFNGFLVDAKVEPISKRMSPYETYTVPENKMLIITFTRGGSIFYDGSYILYGIDGIGIKGPSEIMFFGSGQTFSCGNSYLKFNGYLKQSIH